MESFASAFLALLLIASQTRSSTATDDTLSCFLRAKSHYVLGDPDKGKYYAFTFQPPTALDRDILDPCFLSCIMSSRCSAILFYKSSPDQSTEEDDNTPSDGSCDRDGREERMESPKATPMIIAGDPRLYSNPVIRQLLDATDKPTTNTGRYDRPRLQLNALNFLWGHQVFANIYHNGNGRNGKYTDRERHGWGQQQQQDNGANGSPAMASTTLPSPTTRRPLTRSVVKAGHVNSIRPEANSRKRYTNRLSSIYSDNGGYRSPYEPRNNDIEEPMGGQMFGPENRQIESETGWNSEKPDVGVKQPRNEDYGVMPRRVETISAETGSRYSKGQDIDVTNITPTAIPTEGSTSYNRKANENSQRSPFSATLTSTLSVGLSQNSRTIIFDDVLLNEGDAYNATSGLFTSPIDGVYVFTLDIRSMRGTLASVKVMRNDRVVHSIRANGRNTGDEGAGSGTVAIFLSRGDDVYAKLFYETGYTYVKKMGSRFTGFKLP
ncbi:hypothetical protein LSH36_37g03016 [Paralvinella palmiformis]|uniref:C1q domain-containing protein n=1 Tax=Paralvinella palmiformis TaxID=53620 RepID=A0AAD9NFP9_9ANNE|nr:hypothetical protein LSH36_37g03016 [Paralvinella palmiformis]